MRTTEVIPPVGSFIKYVPGPAPTCIPSLVFSYILQSVIVLEAKRGCLKNCEERVICLFDWKIELTTEDQALRIAC